MKTYGILTDEWLVSYASGALSEAHALVVASHCHFHPDLQNKVADAEDIGGALMNESEPANISYIIVASSNNSFRCIISASTKSFLPNSCTEALT